MKHIYVLLLFTTVFFLSIQNGFAQEDLNTVQSSQNIEGLALYPNPVRSSTKTIYITSKSNALKKVSIYNVLGKQISKTVFTNKTLDISALKSGIYILKITESNISETRKLVIK